MKRLIYTLFILLTICYSCDSFLDVRPTGEIVNNELFETAEGFEEAIYGVYSYLAREPLYGKNMTYGLVDVVGQYFSGGWDQHWSNTNIWKCARKSMRYGNPCIKGSLT